MCGGTSSTPEESLRPTINENQNTTLEINQEESIPPIPSVNFDIIDIYNSKLVYELCSDAQDIDSTSEECLRQYRDNLEFVFSYANELEQYMNDLNSYFQNYPEAFTEEYRNLLAFINNEYANVPQMYGTVGMKYQERFGNTDQDSSTPRTTIPSSENYLDYRDVKVFKASTISDQHIDILTKYIEYTEQLLFTDKRVKRENLYPILVVQLDSENYQSAITLEEEYCQYLNDEYPQHLIILDVIRRIMKKADGSIGLFTDGGRVSGSLLAEHLAIENVVIFL